jgi:hypothetical protein
MKSKMIVDDPNQETLFGEIRYSKWVVLRVTKTNFKGRDTIHIRFWKRDGDGKLCPCGGIALRPDVVRPLRRILRDVVSQLKDAQ